MQKEIFEQPGAISNTLEMQVGAASARISSAPPRSRAQGDRQRADPRLRHELLRRLVARYWIEAIAGCRCTVEIASEYRYRTSVAESETARRRDLAIGRDGRYTGRAQAREVAGHEPHARACATSRRVAMVRETALRFMTRAGAEIGVASTKAFTTQLAASTCSR
jgi:glucosamine--fructose-6-phosphate aminotransferase (isomerizing)